MDEETLVDRFEQHRAHLNAVAYRMLGSLAEAEDAVQETWLRLSRTDVSDVENLGGWLTRVVSRICLDKLRTRTSRREDSLSLHEADPVISSPDGIDPEQEVLLADSVGLALMVVLEMLAPAERVAFVLHDMFSLAFDEVAPVVGKSVDATRQLASRARRRVQGVTTVPDVDLTVQRQAVDAFFAAARDGDLEGLVAVLDPDIVLRSDGGAALPALTVEVRGADKVAKRARAFSSPERILHPVLVNGVVGVIVEEAGRIFSVMAFTVVAGGDGVAGHQPVSGKIVAIDALADPDRLAAMDIKF